MINRSEFPASTSRSSRWAWGVFVGALLAWGSVAAAQPPTGQPAASAPGEDLSEAVIQQRLQAAQESQELDEDTKKKIAELYNQALVQLRRATELAKVTEEYKQTAERAPERARHLQQEITALKGTNPSIPAGATLQELQGEVAAKELKLTELKGALAKLEAEPANRGNRRKEIRTALVVAQERLQEINNQLETPPPANEPNALTQARRTELLTRRRVIEREIPAFHTELASYDAQDAVDLLRLERDKLNLQIQLAQEELRMLNARLKQLRDQAAQEAVRQAQEELIQTQPLLKPLAERNKELAERAHEVTQATAVTEQKLKSAREVLDSLGKQFEKTKRTIESVGLTDAVGMMLRKQRATLPDVSQARLNVAERRAVINDAHYALFEYDDERTSLVRPEAIVAEILRSSPQPRNPDRVAMLEQAAARVLERRREYLDTLYKSYNSYFDTLVQLDTVEQQLIRLSEQYHAYIDERILWIRSSKPMIDNWRLDRSDAVFLDPQHWRRLGERLWQDVNRASLIYAAALLVLGTLFYQRRAMRREIREVGDQAGSRAAHQFWPTVRAAMLTVLVAVPWPGIVFFLAWRLHQIAGNDQFLAPLAQGLLTVSMAYLPPEAMRQVCRPQGLAESHFQWPRSAVQILRKKLQLLLVLGLPLVLITSTLYAYDPFHGTDWFERSCFILGTILLALFLRQVLSPTRGVFREYVAYHQGGWLDRLKEVWYWLGVLLPLALGGLAFWGYYYTARQLAWRLYVSVCLLGALVILRALMVRLILVRRRKLSIQQAKERLAQMAASHATSSGSSDAQRMGVGVETEEPSIDLTTQMLQTRRMLTSGVLAVGVIGFWMIWHQVFPALGMLDRWTLWTSTVQVADVTPIANTASGGMSSGAESATAAAPVMRTVVQEVTFADLGLAVLVVVVTIVAFRNLPGLMEMTLLQRLPLESSVRYAINSLASYAIVFVGLVLTFQTLGLRWSQIQWLATALTFGLAFGLQEIFANFVAGLIILFERPIRVGDVVTVADVTGVVSRLRIRATTITNWDRKEFVVPNKEFITGRILNWTLTDSVNRVVVNVGVAYGSDTERAREIMLKISTEHPLVAQNPPPVATFEGFGDNSLNLTLRVFLPTMDTRLQVIHELHTGIHQAFREAGIEIAFPQRDLHIRSLPSTPAAPPWATSLAGGNGEPSDS